MSWPQVVVQYDALQNFVAHPSVKHPSEIKHIEVTFS